MAGIIGADGDQSKMSGVAPNANLYPVKVAGSESGGSLSNVIAGLDWVLDNQSHEEIDLVNMSLGSSSLPGDGLFKKAIQETIQHKIPIVVSAGNDRSSVQNYSPAQYEGVITVSALGSGKKEFGNFSNYGESVDLTAPGVNVPSTVPGGYGTKSGTSVSAPHVTGAAALLIGRMNERVHPRLVESGLRAMGVRKDWKGDPDESNEPMVYLQQAQVLGSQLIFGDLGEKKEEDPGGYMGVKPRESVQKSIDNAHLRPLTLFVPYVGDIIHIKDTTVQLKIQSGSEKVTLWKTRRKNQEISSTSWNILEKPDTVYIEGDHVSESAQDVTLSMTVSNKQGTWTDTVKVTVFGIKEVRFEQKEGITGKEDSEEEIEDEEDQKRRIFPGKISPEPDAPKNNKIPVLTIVKPKPDENKRLPLYMKSYDVDDPKYGAKQPNPVDGEDKLKDNYGGCTGKECEKGSIPKSGLLNPDQNKKQNQIVNVKTDEEGVAEVVFQVTMQPGDNFRIASTVGSKEVLQNIGIQRDESGLVHDPNAGLYFGNGRGEQLPFGRVIDQKGKATVSGRLLTVWRKLHLERDTMATPERDDQEFGTEKPFPNDPYPGELKHPSIKLVNRKFKPAKIAAVEMQPRYDQTDGAKFVHHLSKQQAPNIAEDVRDEYSQSDFWVVHLLGAYDPFHTPENSDRNIADADPDKEAPAAIFGFSPNFLSDSDGPSVIFQESTRDLFENHDEFKDRELVDRNLYRKRLVVHEIGHRFELEHPKGEPCTFDIMANCANLTGNDNANQFTKKAIATIRDITKPD